MFKRIENPISPFDRYFKEADGDDEDGPVSVTVAPRSNRGSDYNDENTNVKVAPRSNRGNDYSADDETDDTAEEPETDGESDYGNDESEDSTDDTDDNTTDEEDTSEENTEDSQKRYTMYLRYLRLYDVLNNITEKLKYIVKDDPDENAVIIKVTDNLNTIKSAMFDYMIMKFKSAQYVEILIYFETVINCIRLNFELIRNNKIVLKQ